MPCKTSTLWLFSGSWAQAETKPSPYPAPLLWGRKKKPINKKHINIFLTALVGQSSQGRTPTRPRDKRDKIGDFTVESNRKRPVCPRHGSQFVPGRGPVCPRDGSYLSQTPSCPKCLCLLVFLLPELMGETKLAKEQGVIAEEHPHHVAGACEIIAAGLFSPEGFRALSLTILFNIFLLISSNFPQEPLR